MKKLKTLTFACFMLMLGTNANAQLGKLKGAVIEGKDKIGKTNGLSEDEVGRGLKEALTEGVKKGVTQLSKENGYFGDASIKILMPEDAQKVEQKLRAIGQGELVDNLIESMNRAAEDAANGAKDVFVPAITNMSLTDAMGILRGADDAATTYLNKTTRDELYTKFMPVIEASLDKLGTTDLWNRVFTAYNKIPMVQKINPDLNDFATNKAIDGLFVQIAKQELEIRKNPGARVSDLLKKVFG
jgi:hypothetical protein